MAGEIAAVRVTDQHDIVCVGDAPKFAHGFSCLHFVGLIDLYTTDANWDRDQGKDQEFYKPAILFQSLHGICLSLLGIDLVRPLYTSCFVRLSHEKEEICKEHKDFTISNV